MNNQEEIVSEKPGVAPESEKHDITKTEALIADEDQGDPAFVEKAGLINGKFVDGRIYLIDV